MAIASYIPKELARDESPKTDRTVTVAHLVSSSPGRIRLRLDKESRQPQNIEQLVNVLKEQLEIYRVRGNPQTGSLTIFYATNHWNFEKIREFLQSLNIAVLTAENKINPHPHQSVAAANVTGFFTDLNKQVREATEGTVDIRFLVPLGFSFLAVRQLLIKGLSLEIIPWYVFAWYAFDSFLKLHYTSDPASKHKILSE
ncbi:HMA2 domain-containing protein [Gloeothece verrucosa]|uniref:Uncharacterized protein n=1 Tax=Gloeothece verrucosa (strain PCC 7822) TaxID=497965 RepID=E0U924_GLOV7|nr:hypothetical protein [Gloeothece verrucosa]ADN16163.1 hypothetical protein Cyan7822_4245 [Gloeothece verrucosa PCC 7822]